ncbi:MAG: Gldg family protein [Planctomycetaceae bacterium]|nr:Gldg family protein [Planctomycetaceae bacterium]
MRSHVIWAVFKRNVTSYFSGVLGYLFIVVFVVMGAFAAFNARFFATNLANLDQLSHWFPYMLLFVVPAITMTTWADEKKTGTDELLFTLPARDFEILLGKYFAVLAVYTIALLFSLTHAMVLAWYGDPDVGILFTTYLGYWLAGAALSAVGMFASVLTGSVTVAFVLGVALCAIPVFIGLAPGSGRWLQGFSIDERLRDFTLGIIPISSFVFFVSLAAFALYLNAVMIARRHWAGGPEGTRMGWQFVVRALSLAVALISVNYMVAQASRRVDLTAEKLFTLSPTSNEAIANIDVQKPITIEAYLSPADEVPQQYVGIRKKLVGLLREIESRGRGKIQVQYVDVAPFSEEAEVAEKWGIEARSVTIEDDGGRYVRKDIFLGTVTRSGYDEVVVPFYGVGDSVEFELARSIGTVSKEQRLTVGILNTDAKLTGGFNSQSFSNDPEWRIVTELKKQYVVKAISPDAKIDESMDVLLAVMPSSLTEPQMANFVDYVKSGKPVLIFDDPVPVTWGMGLQQAPLMPKPSPGGGMMGMQQPSEPKASGGRATELVNALDIAWDPGQVVFDAFNPHPEFFDVVRPELVWVMPSSGSANAFNQESPVTRGLQEMLMFFPGSVRPREDSKFEFTKLLLTGTKNSGTIDWDEITAPGIFGGRTINPFPVRQLDDYAHVLAAHIRSKSSGDSGGGVNAIFVADSDVISDESFRLREDVFLELSIDNVTFVTNAVDFLAGEPRYIDLRSRRPQQRSLSEIQKQRDQFVNMRIERQKTAKEQADERLEDARKRLQELVDTIQKDTSMDAATKTQKLRNAQQSLNRQLTLEEREIEREKEAEVRRAKIESERAIKNIENRVWLWAVLLPPIPAIFVGLIMLSLRITNERQNIDASRRV